MSYEIIEGNFCDIKNYGVFTKIVVDDFSLLVNKKYKQIIESMLKSDETLKYLHITDDIFSIIIDYVVNDSKFDNLIDNLNIKKFPLYSMIVNIANNYRKKYQIIGELESACQIIFKCNTNNLLNILSLSTYFNVPIILDATEISLEEYKHILSSFDFKKIEGLNVAINYQEGNTYIDPKTLYETSLLICNISEEIKRINLSPIEKITYAYDIVKNRKYRECKENMKMSRDLDKILVGDAIVCVGYSNFLNAILKCLNINVIPLIDIKRRHQCSLVYVNDPKYNIDGVYVFDPTGDRKRVDDETYIGNYKFFATPVNLKDTDIFGDVLKTISLGFDKIIEKINGDDIKESSKILDDLEILFNIADIDDFDNFVLGINLYEISSNEEKNRILVTYMKFLSKFSSEEINLEDFVKILYNTRRVQYYNNIISSFDTESVFKATYDRFTYLQALRVKKEEKDHIRYLLKMRFYRDRIADLLLNKGDVIIESSLQEGLDISRDKENIKLLKVLRNRQKQLTEDQK